MWRNPCGGEEIPEKIETIWNDKQNVNPLASLAIYGDLWEILVKPVNLSRLLWPSGFVLIRNPCDQIAHTIIHWHGSIAEGKMVISSSRNTSWNSCHIKQKFNTLPRNSSKALKSSREDLLFNLSLHRLFLGASMCCWIKGADPSHLS